MLLKLKAQLNSLLSIRAAAAFGLIRAAPRISAYALGASHKRRGWARYRDDQLNTWAGRRKLTDFTSCRCSYDRGYDGKLPFLQV
jgi:hypothetical protein